MNSQEQEGQIDRPDDLDQALDVLYDEIAALEEEIDYELTLSTAEFRALFAIVKLAKEFLPMSTAERQSALNYLFEVLCEIELDTQVTAGKLIH